MNSAPTPKTEPNENDVAVLNALKDKGPMTSVQIASHLSAMPGSIVVPLRRLSPHGFIRHSHVGSRILATITDAGRKYVARSASKFH